MQGGAILTAAESSGTSSAGVNITGLFTGYEDDSAYDNGSAGGDLGSLDPEDTTKILGLLSFSNARAAGNEANKTMVVVAVGFDPAKAYINRRAYTLGALVNNHFKALTGLDGSYLKAGQKYLINIEKSDGTKAFPDVTLKQGEIYFWDGLQWIQEKRGLELSEVNARIDAKVPGSSGPMPTPQGSFSSRLISGWGHKLNMTPPRKQQTASFLWSKAWRLG